jgi:hypothetical protein
MPWLSLVNHSLRKVTCDKDNVRRILVMSFILRLGIIVLIEITQGSAFRVYVCNY